MEEFLNESSASLEHSLMGGTSAFVNGPSSSFHYGPTGLTILAATACAYGELVDSSPDMVVLKLNTFLIDAPSTSLPQMGHVNSFDASSYLPQSPYKKPFYYPY